METDDKRETDDKSNEKNKTNVEHKNLNGIYFVLLILLFALVSFFTAKARIRTFSLGYEVARLKKERAKLQKEAVDLEAQKAYWISYPALLKQNKELELQLLPPDELISPQKDNKNN